MKIPIFILIFSLLLACDAKAEPLRVVATTPDLGALALEIGGPNIELSVLAKPTEDPHFLDAKPSFIRVLSRADAFILTGLDLEVGWAPLLLQSARNARILPGQPGHIDASVAITPMEVPTGPIDRSHGDLHAGGNPHYLLDPNAGRAVAGLLRDRFSELQPAKADLYQKNYGDFIRRLDEEESRWIERMTKHQGAALVADHNLWIYFAHRFGLRIVEYLEPKPGIPPSTRHLHDVIQVMKREGAHVILAAPYFDEGHAHFVARRTGASIARLAHQPGSRPGSEGYIGMIRHNVDELAKALDASL